MNIMQCVAGIAGAILVLVFVYGIIMLYYLKKIISGQKETSSRIGKALSALERILSQDGRMAEYTNSILDFLKSLDIFEEYDE